MSKRHRSRSRSPPARRRKDRSRSPPRRSSRRSISRSRSPIYSRDRSSRKICKSYARGSCFRGSQCWFLHEEADDSDRSWDKRARKYEYEERPGKRDSGYRREVDKLRGLDDEGANKLPVPSRGNPDDMPQIQRKDELGQEREHEEPQPQQENVNVDRDANGDTRPARESIVVEAPAPAPAPIPELQSDQQAMAAGASDLSPEHAANPNGEHSSQKRGEKESRSLKLLRNAVTDFVKESLKPAWKEGHLSKEAFKTIAQKAVDKVIGTLQGHEIPKGQAKIEQFMDSSQAKIARLVQGYLEKYSVP